ncbi:OLC1v1029899C1 [Oldenlandia corymbosa var. corymbosa]|uniref:OLC1v1029899C1 n=1 Tax=Oldenlandia corymbosa var. corymbosa TaxID=529605 RepID=A0AAV1CFJ3_OLDCO|nr:OLC1v1029899C1 [Oldenlandia corymbosa var. corymbosa]
MSFIIIILLIFSSLCSSSYAVPLSTRSRWIVDHETGKRVKLACANWEGHVQMLPEGLNKQPLYHIAREISLMGFNCVRLTYATYMFTHHADVTVAKNLENNNLTSALQGVKKHNPHLLSLSLVDAQKAVVDALGSHGVMVLLDCQVSKPMWCCNDDDGNGFFGDQYFDPQDWLNALAIVAKRYKHTPMVMGMSLRNELRGPRQDQNVWYKYVKEGTKLIHRENPNVLIVISGLDYDIDFSFLKNNPLNLNLHKKLVYETHRYAFSEGQYGLWSNTSINYMCQNVIQEIEAKSGFLFKGKHAAPLIVTEFGIDLNQNTQTDSSFLTCLLAWMAENDLDWAIWAGHGSYYLRDGNQDPEESYGMFDGTWTKLRNEDFHTKIQLIQQILQVPFSRHPMHRLLYHPLSGSCGVAQGNQVLAGDCWKTSIWSFRGEGSPIRLKGSHRCLTAVGDGLPVVLTDYCSGESSRWKLARNSMYQLANKDDNGNELCLDFDPNISKKVLTRKCIVAGEDDAVKLQGQENQWFVLVKSNAK